MPAALKKACFENFYQLCKQMPNYTQIEFSNMYLTKYKCSSIYYIYVLHSDQLDAQNLVFVCRVLKEGQKMIHLGT